METFPWHPFEIVLDRQANLIGQRKFQWLAGFGLASVNLPFSPMKAVKGKSHDIAGA
jgi:hypothetical protein